MDKTYKLIVVFLLIAVVFFTIAIVINQYFPELSFRGYNPSSYQPPVEGSKIKIFVENPDLPTTQ